MKEKQQKLLSKVISFVGTKGGVWKSTGVQCISSSRVFKKYKVGILDADSQETLVIWSGKRQKGLPLGIDVLKHNTSRKLMEEIDEHKQNYDFLFVDLPGQSQALTLTRTAIACSDICILPLKPYDKDIDAFDLNMRPVIREALKFIDQKHFRLLATFAHYNTNPVNYLKFFENIEIIDKLKNIHRDRAIYTYFSMNGLTLEEYRDQQSVGSDEYKKAQSAINDIELIAREIFDLVV